MAPTLPTRPLYEHYYDWRDDPSLKQRILLERAQIILSGYRWAWLKVQPENGQFYFGFFGCDPKGNGLYIWQDDAWELISPRSSRTTSAYKLAERVARIYGWAKQSGDTMIQASGGWPSRSKIPKRVTKRRRAI